VPVKANERERGTKLHGFVPLGLGEEERARGYGSGLDQIDEPIVEGVVSACHVAAIGRVEAASHAKANHAEGSTRTSVSACAESGEVPGQISKGNVGRRERIGAARFGNTVPRSRAPRS